MVGSCFQNWSDPDTVLKIWADPDPSIKSIQNLTFLQYLVISVISVISIDSHTISILLTFMLKEKGRANFNWKIWVGSGFGSGFFFEGRIRFFSRRSDPVFSLRPDPYPDRIFSLMSLWTATLLIVQVTLGFPTSLRMVGKVKMGKFVKEIETLTK